MVKFRIVTNIKEAERLWELFSPHITLDDEWKFRYTFYKYFSYDLHFIVGEVEGEMIGLLPLQHNSHSCVYEFFGGCVMGENQVFLIPGASEYEAAFYAQAPKPSRLTALKTSSHIEGIKSYDPNFVVSLEDINTYEEFIDTYWSKTTANKVRSQIRKLHAEHDIEVVYNNYEDIEFLFEQSIKNFGDDSSFSQIHRAESYRDLIEEFQAVIISIKVDGEVRSVSLSIPWKQTYRCMNSATNKDVRDVGKFHLLVKIEKACSYGTKILEAGRKDGGWKTNFGLSQVPGYLIEQ